MQGENIMQRTKQADAVTKSVRHPALSARLKTYKMHRALLLMMIPGMLYYLLFHYKPMYGLLIAFKDYRILDGVMASPWAGLKYFKMAFGSDEFWRVFKNTLILSGYKLIFTFPAPIILALMLNEVRCLKFKKVVQTMTYMPHFISWVVLAGVIINFLSPSVGPINMIIKAMGFEPIYFMGDKKYFRGILVISSIWKEVGWGTIIYLAALSNVDTQLYEAAVLDGAGRFRQTISVTLPAIANVIVIMLIMQVGKIINDDFDQIYNMYNPAVYSVADVLSTYIYKMGLEQAMYSFSTAVGLFKNVIAFALVLMTNAISNRVSDYGLW